MTYYHNNTEVVKITLPKNNLVKTLPVGVYHFCQNKTIQGIDLFFKKGSVFKFPEQLFGDAEQRAQYYLKYYERTKQAFSILLAGVSGTGKSLLAKRTAQLFAERHNMPTIIIDKGTKDFVREAISKLKQPSVIILDEFEKIWDKEAQNDLLSLLDGVYAQEHIFILTANETDEVSQYMFNRPKRIRYMTTYENLSAFQVNELVEHFADKHKLSAERTLEIIKEVMEMEQPTYDNLIEFIEEVILFPEIPAKELIGRFGVTTYPWDTPPYLMEITLENLDLLSYIAKLFGLSKEFKEKLIDGLGDAFYIEIRDFLNTKEFWLLRNMLNLEYDPSTIKQTDVANEFVVKAKLKMPEGFNASKFSSFFDGILPGDVEKYEEKWRTLDRKTVQLYLKPDARKRDNVERAF